MQGALDGVGVVFHHLFAAAFVDAQHVLLLTASFHLHRFDIDDFHGLVGVKQVGVHHLRCHVGVEVLHALAHIEIGEAVDACLGGYPCHACQHTSVGGSLGRA